MVKFKFSKRTWIIGGSIFGALVIIAIIVTVVLVEKKKEKEKKGCPKGLNNQICSGDRGVCDKKLGICQCNNHFSGPSCDTCEIGWGGDNCDTCAPNWAEPDCDKCATGWGGPNCSECATGWGGDNCDKCASNWGPPKKCDKCAKGWTGTDCTECVDGWEPPDCNKCAYGRYGDNCQYTMCDKDYFKDKKYDYCEDIAKCENNIEWCNRDTGKCENIYYSGNYGKASIPKRIYCTQTKGLSCAKYNKACCKFPKWGVDPNSCGYEVCNKDYFKDKDYYDYCEDNELCWKDKGNLSFCNPESGNCEGIFKSPYKTGNLPRRVFCNATQKCKKSGASHWGCCQPKYYDWGSAKGVPYTCKDPKQKSGKCIYNKGMYYNCLYGCESIYGPNCFKSCPKGTCFDQLREECITCKKGEVCNDTLQMCIPTKS